MNGAGAGWELHVVLWDVVRGRDQDCVYGAAGHGSGLSEIGPGQSVSLGGHPKMQGVGGRNGLCRIRSGILQGHGVHEEVRQQVLGKADRKRRIMTLPLSLLSSGIFSGLAPV